MTRLGCSFELITCGLDLAHHAEMVSSDEVRQLVLSPAPPDEFGNLYVNPASL